MPVADLAEGSRVHVRAGLARIKQRDQHDEEHHVAGQGAEDEGAGAMRASRGRAADFATRRRRRRHHLRWAGDLQAACRLFLALCARSPTGWA